MLKITKKLNLNFKILRFFIIPTILVLTPFFNNSQDARRGLNSSGIKTIVIED